MRKLLAIWCLNSSSINYFSQFILLLNYICRKFVRMIKELRLTNKYLKYLIKSKIRHGIHSPFVYSFISDVFYDKSEHAEYKKVEKLRNLMYSDKSLINIEDLGAGSRLGNSKQNTVSSVCKKSALSKKYAKLLFRLVKIYKPSSILEFGTSFGLSTIYFSLANPNSKIYTIEGSEEIYMKANENFKLLGLKNIISLQGSFIYNIDKVLNEENSFDFIFFDGDHTYESTIIYFEKCLSKINNNSIFVFDDINWSEEMERAWFYIKNHKEVRVTIDIFFMGFVFFDKRLSKQNFVLRF